MLHPKIQERRKSPKKLRGKEWIELKINCKNLYYLTFLTCKTEQFHEFTSEKVDLYIYTKRILTNYIRRFANKSIALRRYQKLKETYATDFTRLVLY